MKLGRLLYILGVLTGVVVVGSCSRSNSLGDNAARVVLDRLWNQPDVYLLLGDVKFVSRNPVTAQGQDSVHEWPLYQAFVRDGVITIQNQKDLTKHFTGWNDWLSLTQDNIRLSATVGLTAKGRARGTLIHQGHVAELALKVATIKVNRIVSNDEERIGSNLYHVVVGTLTYNVPRDMSAAFAAARGWNHVRKRRFRVLLKYDAINKDWVEVAAIAKPPDQNSLIRAQVSEGAVLMTGGPKVAVSEYYSNHGTFPPTNLSAGIATAASISGKYVSGVNIAGGVITATFGLGANKAIQKDTFILSPIASSGSINWTCNVAAATVPQKYLPSSCRK